MYRIRSDSGSRQRNVHGICTEKGKRDFLTEATGDRGKIVWTVQTGKELIWRI